MVSQSKAHPEIAAEFNNCNFTRQAFSSMAIDQAHEQNNATVKSVDGAFGLTQTPEALRCWMVAGPEQVRMTAEFEASIGGMHNRMTRETWHLRRQSSQVIFALHIKSLVEVMEEIGNPFKEETLVEVMEEIGNPFKEESLVEVMEEIGNPFKEESKDFIQTSYKRHHQPSCGIFCSPG